MDTIVDYQGKDFIDMPIKTNLAAICPVDYAFKRIGGKYKGRIIWHLHLDGVLRYGALRKEMTDITPKMLTQTLRELEEDGLVSRKVYLEVPPRVEYRLTAVAEELIPFIQHLKQWGKRQMDREQAKTGNLTCS